jgi:thiol-disulfide isomerase/thioredoxin
LLLLSAGCDEPQNKPRTVRDRSEVVAGSSAASTVVSTTASAAPPKKARSLCTSKPSGKPSESKIEAVTAPGATAPSVPIPFGAGKWIWVNLWAAWCAPCKEEMPRLMKWEKDLRKSGILIDLAFVSLDDDERQRDRFLASQPEDGLRASYWLSESAREKWLGAFGISPSATLPVHALVSPKGELVCIIHGALEDSDFPRIAAVVKNG